MRWGQREVKGQGQRRTSPHHPPGWAPFVVMVLAVVLLGGGAVALLRRADPRPAPLPAVVASAANRTLATSVGAPAAVAPFGGIPGVQAWRPPVALPLLTGVPSAWTATQHTLESGGLARTYLEIRPPAVTGRTLPVVLILHGRGLTPASMERLSHLVPALGPAIDVFPTGFGRSWDAGGCCGVAHQDDVDDVAFLEAVMHHVLTLNTDASAHQVFVVGYSNGGRMAMHLACADPGAFSALVAVEAVPVAPCAAMAPLPTLLIDSSADPLLTIPAHGRPKVMQGYVEPTVGATVDEYQRLDGCRGRGVVTRAGALDATVWADCAGAGRLQYDLYQGGSHRWPTGGGPTPPAQAAVAHFLLGPGQVPTTAVTGPAGGLTR